MSIEISSLLESGMNSSSQSDAYATDTDNKIFVKKFERQMMRMQILGLIVVAMHKLSMFIHACALAWASLFVVSQASYLYEADVRRVAILLVLEAVSFFYRDVFNRLVSTTSFKIFMYSRRPHHLNKIMARSVIVLRLFAIGSVFCFLIWKSQLSITGLGSSKHNYPQIETMAYPNLVKFSLQVFYLLVTINVYIGMFTDYGCHIDAIYRASGERVSQLGYYDAVMSKGIQEGFMKASMLSVVEFAYQLQAMKYLRGMNPLVVLEKYPKLIKYLLYKQEGIEHAFLALGSDDLYKQLAAASVVGLWARLDGSGAVDCWKLRWLHANLLPKLADKLQGSGLVGEAAADSFFFLGIEHPDLVVHVQTSEGKNIVDILMDLIHIHNPYLLCYVRVVIPLIDTLDELRWQMSDAGGIEKAELERRLTWTILQKPGLTVRQSVTVAYALFKLRAGTLSETVKEKLEQLRPEDHKEFWMDSEKAWMAEMLGGDIPPRCAEIRVILENGFP